MRIVSGMRPTGKLHLGHYLGVLKNWVTLQQENDCHFFVADWHALSTSYEDRLNLKLLGKELVKDWIAAGIDPDKSTLFVQSAIKEHAELYVLLNMITPLGWLERNPTYKDQLAQMRHKEIHTAGFLTYPVLQAADIILYQADLVPIGEDQKPHLEITREIVRRFHHLFDCEVFTEPKEMLTETSRLPGLDGRKMSKSYNNAIFLSDTPEEVWQKLRVAKTDPQRVRRNDPGDPDVCLVFDYHKALTDDVTVQKIDADCRAGTIGCIDCKKICAQSIDRLLEPMRERRATLDDGTIDAIVEEGNARAKNEAAATMAKANKAVFEISCDI
ncbi:tryptophan--tRNA ligase [Hydrogenimonas urashimensis]|uniref:tryptophan--tRNA ligase n=1 Tax=Hydrogenimonas urashimensis TaxID=2740515 RepID=UPI001914D9DA|nr:tryptophan--tRNA ligase [Hydrogenimonas urashimensis]